jgi:hypothetical protein
MLGGGRAHTINVKKSAVTHFSIISLNPCTRPVWKQHQAFAATLIFSRAFSCSLRFSLVKPFRRQIVVKPGSE